MAYVTVQGTVGRTFFDGKGADVVEEFTKRDGTAGKTRWGVFFEQPHGLSVGDRVEVSGQHSDRVDEWVKDGETRHVVKRTINRAKIKGSAATESRQTADNPSSGSTGGFDGSPSQAGVWPPVEVPF